MYPRETLVVDVKVMDDLFKEYHQSSSDGLLRTANVIANLVEILAEKFEHKYDSKLLRKLRIRKLRILYKLPYIFDPGSLLAECTMYVCNG